MTVFSVQQQSVPRQHKNEKTCLWSRKPGTREWLFRSLVLIVWQFVTLGLMPCLFSFPSLFTFHGHRSGHPHLSTNLDSQLSCTNAQTQNSSSKTLWFRNISQRTWKLRDSATSQNATEENFSDGGSQLYHGTMAPWIATLLFTVFRISLRKHLWIPSTSLVLRYT